MALVVLVNRRLDWAALRISVSLHSGDNYSLMNFAVFMMALIMNFLESNFLYMTPMDLLLWLAAIGHARAYNVSRPVEVRRPAPSRHADARPAQPGLRSPRFRTT